jgi:hypothetical protein
MRFGTCKIRSLHRAGSLVTASKELSKYKLDLEGVQEAQSHEVKRIREKREVSHRCLMFEDLEDLDAEVDIDSV